VIHFSLSFDESKSFFNKVQLSVQFWKSPTVLSHSPEINWLFLIHVSTFPAFKILSLNRSYLIVKVRIATISSAQAFSILFYSQIYCIPFGLISRFLQSFWWQIAVIVPAVLLQPIYAYRLTSLLLSGDLELRDGLCHIVYRIAILIWSEFTALSTPDSEN
jgi:hypothetical protein